MNNDKAENYINAVGALAESVALFYKELIGNGLPQDVAEKETMTFIASSLTPHQKEDQNDGQT